MLCDTSCTPSHSWAYADSTLSVLELLLHLPLAEHAGIAAVLPPGGLYDAHVIHLADLAAQLNVYFDVDHSASAHALHV